MNIPVEILFSGIEGGSFEAKGFRGWWWKGGKVIAEWRRNPHTKQAVVTWYVKRPKKQR